jgi:hypothetical protein
VTGNRLIGGNKELRKPRGVRALIIEREVEERFLLSKRCNCKRRLCSIPDFDPVNPQ